jgi:polysaccharide biosynthesis/export protein
MWAEKGAPALIAVLLAAVSLAGCATSLNKTASSLNGGTDSTSSSKGQPVSDGLAPSFNSTEQNASNGVSPRQGTGPVHDASAARTAESLASVAKPGNTGYRIGPQDVLDISVFQAPELSKTVEVDENGTIDLPLVGETPASGKTALELQRDLDSKLGTKYLQHPQVTVMVKEFNSNRVTVSGAVKSPGVFPYKGETLFQFVTMAGGLAPESNSMALVLREINGKRSAAKFNLADVSTGRAEDPKVQSGDVIVVDTSVVKEGLNNILRILPLAGFAALL